MKIKERLEVNQPEEYCKLKEQLDEKKDFRKRDNKFMMVLLYIDSLLDKPIKKLLHLREKVKFNS